MNLQQMLLLRTMLCNAAGDVPAARGPQTEGGAPIETAFGEAAPMRDELLIAIQQNARGANTTTPGSMRSRPTVLERLPQHGEQLLASEL